MTRDVPACVIRATRHSSGRCSPCPGAATSLESAPREAVTSSGKVCPSGCRGPAGASGTSVAPRAAGAPSRLRHQDGEGRRPAGASDQEEPTKRLADRTHSSNPTANVNIPAREHHTHQMRGSHVACRERNTPGPVRSACRCASAPRGLGGPPPRMTLRAGRPVQMQAVHHVSPGRRQTVIRLVAHRRARSRVQAGTIMSTTQPQHDSSAHRTDRGHAIETRAARKTPALIAHLAAVVAVAVTAFVVDDDGENTADPFGAGQTPALSPS